MTPPKQVSAASGRTLESTRSKEILRVAANLFGDMGYASTTMHDIGDAAGVLPGSLYHHFASKEDIAIELLSEFYTELEEVVAARLAAARGRPEPGTRLLHDLVTDVVSIGLRHVGAIRLRAYEVPTTATHKLRELVKYQPAHLDRAWRQAVNAAKPLLRVPQVDPRLLRATLHQLTLEISQLLPPTADAAAVGEQLCRVLLHGLTPQCPPEEELDRSAAARVAKEVIAGWRSGARGNPRDRLSSIIAVARREFARRGYDATTIRDIADAAGITMGTLYRNVGSKEALLAEILRDYSTHLESGIRRVLGTESTKTETLDALGMLITHASRRFREEYNIVKLWPGGEQPGPVADYFSETDRRLRLLIDFLAEGRREGSFDIEGEVDTTAILVRSIMWLPLDESMRVSANRVHRFFRESVLRGAQAA